MTTAERIEAINPEISNTAYIFLLKGKIRLRKDLNYAEEYFKAQDIFTKLKSCSCYFSHRNGDLELLAHMPEGTTPVIYFKEQVKILKRKIKLCQERLSKNHFPVDYPPKERIELHLNNCSSDLQILQDYLKNN